MYHESKRIPVYIETINTEPEKERSLIDMRGLAATLRKLAQEKSISYGKISSLSYIAPATISRIITGQNPDVHLLKMDRIARVFGLKLSEFIAIVEANNANQ